MTVRLTILALGIGGSLGCGPPRPIAPALALDGDTGRGEATYQVVCAGCHGAEGYGIARAPALVSALPRMTDEAVMTVMLHGRGGMPAKRIEDQQAADILSWMRQRWGPVATDAPPSSAPTR